MSISNKGRMNIHRFTYITGLLVFSMIAAPGSDVNSSDRVVWEQLKTEVEMLPDSTAKQQFAFTNKSSSPVTITLAKASCSCVVADYPKDQIAPNASGVVSVSISSAGRHKDFSNSVAIQFSDKSLFSLECSVKLIGSVIVSPRQIVWDKENVFEKKQIEIDMSHSKEASLISVDTTGEDYSITSEYKPEVSKWGLVVAPLSPNPNPAILTITTESSKKKSFYYVLLSPPKQ